MMMVNLSDLAALPAGLHGYTQNGIGSSSGAT
jgi:hypothetical protein